jgi:hypothetical protein
MMHWMSFGGALGLSLISRAGPNRFSFRVRVSRAIDDAMVVSGEDEDYVDVEGPVRNFVLLVEAGH